MHQETSQNKEIKKAQVKEVVLFAINNIPQVDPLTLKRFLELVNVGGTYGSISHQQILRKMGQVVKYVPGSSVRSLLVVTDLLEIEPPQQLFLKSPQNGSSRADGSEPFFIDIVRPVTPTHRDHF